MLAFCNNDRYGPTIEIGLSAARPGEDRSLPPSGTVWANAIVDTGAMTTCISAAAAVRAALPIIGKGQVRSASHVVSVNLFYGDLWIRGTSVGGASYTWPFHDRTFTELALSGATSEALLGMDVIREGVLIVNGPQQRTTFAW